MTAPRRRWSFPNPWEMLLGVGVVVAWVLACAWAMQQGDECGQDAIARMRAAPPPINAEVTDE